MFLNFIILGSSTAADEPIIWNTASNVVIKVASLTEKYCEAKTLYRKQKMVYLTLNQRNEAF
jgi:hypothetical protein